MYRESSHRKLLRSGVNIETQFRNVTDGPYTSRVGAGSVADALPGADDTIISVTSKCTSLCFSLLYTRRTIEKPEISNRQTHKPMSINTKRNILDCDQSNYSSRIILSHIPTKLLSWKWIR